MNKIKKILSIIPLLFVMMLIVTSCENEHQHSYAMKSNETKHWKECECGEKSEEGSHNFGNWNTTKEPTVSTTGTKERECSVCQYKETETIPVLKHDTHSYTTTKSNETKHWKECECGEKSEEENHTFGDWTTTKEATSTTTGLKERECSVCHYKETESIPVNSHTHSYTTTKYNETKHWKECSCGEKSEEENHTLGDWETVKEASYTESGQQKRVCNKCEYQETEDIPVKEITDISTFLEENNDIIVENLKPLYDGVLKQAFRNAYETRKDWVTHYRWDLGEVVGGKIQNLKLVFTFVNNTSSTIRVYNVILDEPLDLINLLNANKVTNAKATYSQTYNYSYDATKQHDRDEVLNKVAELELNGFEYNDLLYTRDSGSTEYGSSSIYTVLFKGNTGIIELRIVLKDASTTAGMITNLNNGNYRVAESKEVDFSNNRLKEVDLTAPTDPNTIEYLIYYHNDEITANLETHYVNAVKKAHGRYYDTERFTMTSYRWDLGEVTDGKIQNLRVILNYHNNVGSVDVIHISNVVLNEAIEIKTLLDATAIFNMKATYSSVYTYTYNPTKQHDRDELIEAILKVAVEDGFKYEMKDVLYTENTQSTDPELGTIRNFKIIISNENGIRDMLVRISNATSDSALINYINNGKYRVSEYNKIYDYINQLKEVDLTVE